MTIQIFDDMKQKNQQGEEVWSARELWKVLWYSEYRNFKVVLEKAIISCKKSWKKPQNHFVEFHDMVDIWSGAQRAIEDIKLSRYACYLIIQNADPSKEIVAFGQRYFSEQTMRQEISQQVNEDSLRVHLRQEMKTHNKNLASTADKAKVTNFGQFTDAGYMGLYGGMRQSDIHTAKKLKKTEKILDHMGSEELAANLFRATQTEAKIRREGIVGQDKASHTHYEIGKKVRRTIEEINGTMPERLPSVEHVKLVEKRLKGKQRVLV